jgi:hypothetical protein
VRSVSPDRFRAVPRGGDDSPSAGTPPGCRLMTLLHWAIRISTPADREPLHDGGFPFGQHRA